MSLINFNTLLNNEFYLYNHSLYIESENNAKNILKLIMINIVIIYDYYLQLLR